MAIREYIGARYVPRFMGTYTASQQYEVLDVVDNGQGTSYILKKPAPAGTPVTNTAYWAIYGATSGAVLNLQNQIDDINDTIGDTPLPGNTDTLTDAIDYAFTHDPYEYIIFIGDSYTEADSLGSDISKRYSTLVANSLGLIEKNYAEGGTSFLAPSGHDNYQYQTIAAIDDFTTHGFDKSKVKYFVIGGNRNDGIIADAQYATYSAAVQNVCERALNAFPNAQIIVLAGLWDYTFYPNAQLETFRSLQMAVNTLVGPLKNRVRIIDDCFRWLAGRFDCILYQNGTKIHPNIKGHKVIANHLYSALSGNDYTVKSCRAFTPTTINSALSNSENMICFVDKANDQVHIFMSFKCTSNKSFGSSEIVLLYHTENYDEISDLYFGQQQMFCPLYGRGAAARNSQVAVMLECYGGINSDSAAAMEIKLSAFGGALIAGETYFIDVVVKNGIMQYRQMFS